MQKTSILSYVTFLLVFQSVLPGSCRSIHPKPHEDRDTHVSLNGEVETTNLSRIMESAGDEHIAPRDNILSRFTYFATGLGACGTYNKPSDFVCAAANFPKPSSLTPTLSR